MGWSVVCNCGILDHTYYFQVNIDVYEDELGQSGDKIPSSHISIFLFTLLHKCVRKAFS